MLAVPQASSAASDSGTIWERIITDEGCIAYVRNYETEDKKGDWRVYHWTGRCAAGTAINGAGSLQMHEFAFDERMVNARSGTLVGGYFEGPGAYVRYAVDARGNFDSSKIFYEMQTVYSHGCAREDELCEQERGPMSEAVHYKKPLYHDVNNKAPAVGG